MRYFLFLFISLLSGAMGVPEHQSFAYSPILTSPTIFHFIRMLEFSLIKGVTVVILATFGEIGI